MKKCFLSFFCSLTSLSAFALPVGNLSEASLLKRGFVGDNAYEDFSNCYAFWSFRAGFYGDYVFNKHFHLDTPGVPTREIDHVRLTTNAAYVALNFLDHLDIFATFGESGFFLETNNLEFGGPLGGRIEIESSRSFSWSMGGRLTFLQWGCTSFGLEGQYFCFQPDLSRLTLANMVSDYLDDTMYLRYHEWQVGIGVAYRISLFSPYIAVKWSNSSTRFNSSSLFFESVLLTLGKLENKKSWGYAIGFSLINCEEMSLTAEARFGDEKALYLNGQLRF